MLHVGLIGPGRAGQALIRLLPPDRYEVGPVLSRSRTSARRVTGRIRLGKPADSEADFSCCDLILIAVPDEALAGVVRRLASPSVSFRRKVVLHTSSALDSSALAALRAGGAAVASLHPLQTLARGVSLSGAYFAAEGDKAAMRLAQRLVADLQGKLIRLRPGQKSPYHIAAAFASPLLASLLEAAVRLMGRAGVPPKTARQALETLLRTTLEHYSPNARQSWAGPLASGEETVRRHLEPLSRLHADLAHYYSAFALAALPLFRPQQAPASSQERSSSQAA